MICSASFILICKFLWIKTSAKWVNVKILFMWWKLCSTFLLNLHKNNIFSLSITRMFPNLSCFWFWVTLFSSITVVPLWWHIQRSALTIQYRRLPQGDRAPAAMVIHADTMTAGPQNKSEPPITTPNTKQARSVLVKTHARIKGESSKISK